MHTGVANGVQQVWLNGELVLSMRNIMFQKKPGHLLSKLTFRNFHGGSTPNFAPDRDQYVWYASHEYTTTVIKNFHVIQSLSNN